MDTISITNFQDLNYLVDGKDSAIFIYNGSNNQIFFSQLASDSFGFPDTIFNPTLEHLVAYIVPDKIKILEKEFYKNIKAKSTHFSLDFTAQAKNKEFIHLYVKINATYNDKGHVECLSGLILDLKDCSTSCSFAEKYAYVDPLTNLGNTKCFIKDFESILKDSDSKGYIILVDLDNYAQISSVYGIAAGDKIVWYLANKLLRVAKKNNGNVYKLLGSRFMIFLPQSTEKSAVSVMIKIRNSLKKEPFSINGKNISITVSSGAVSYLGGLDKVDRLMLNAEIVVQKIKDSGRDNYTVYNRGDGIMDMKQIQLISSLTDSVHNNCHNFQLYYQPIFSSKSNKCIGAEALLRWISPTNEVISPNLIIPILEKAKLMAEIENWIINQSCKQCYEWIKVSQNNDFFVHINLSPKQITRATLFNEVLAAINDDNILPANIVLEATETATMLELDKGVSLLTELRKIGVQIAIDDFGTGYSSLGYLKDLPVDEIKVDRMFVKNIESDTSSKNFLTAIIQIIQSMNYKVCIEGVENESQKKILQESNVDTLQGFHFSKPVPTRDFERSFLTDELQELLA